MSEEKKPILSIHDIIVDGIGTILLVLGLVDWFGKSPIVPESLRFENYYIYLTVIGALLMLPAVIKIIKSKLAPTKEI